MGAFDAVGASEISLDAAVDILSDLCTLLSFGCSEIELVVAVVATLGCSAVEEVVVFVNVAARRGGLLWSGGDQVTRAVCYSPTSARSIWL